MRLTGNLGHLTYCTNIHAGENWFDTFAQIKKNLPAIKQKVSPLAPLGVGLRLSAQAAAVLVEKEILASFRQWLDAEGLYVFTINGFPYGDFHGSRVKEKVYSPDWRVRARLEYTRQLADILSGLLPEMVEGSISTVPVGFDMGIEGLEFARNNLVECAAYFEEVRVKTGKVIRLAIEPEPGCYMDVADNIIAFFNDILFVHESIVHLAKLLNKTEYESEMLLRENLGVCVDACHASVMFEEPLELVEKLHAAGIHIVKLQLTAALTVPVMDMASIQSLRQFDESVYLHQTSVRTANKRYFFVDLPDAINAFTTGGIPSSAEWRIHYHVPVFLQQLELFQTTSDDLVRLLSCHRASPICQHLEVETYTFDVLPESFKNLSLVDHIVREIDWVRGLLTS